MLAFYSNNSCCRSIPPNFEKLRFEQKRLNPIRSNISIQERPKDVHNNLNDDLFYHHNALHPSGSEQQSFANNIEPERFYNESEIIRRGLDNLTTKKYSSELEKLEAMLAKDLANRLGEKKFNLSECPSCEEEVIIKGTLQPAYKCDKWIPKQRLCILERNIGDTVTFYLTTGKEEDMYQSNVTWKKEFHMRYSDTKKEFIIDHKIPPENIIVGRRGFELRISPITETDMEYNMFSATLPTTKSPLYFIIRIVPIDLGFVYVGETIELNLHNFVSLPERSMSYKWYMEKDGEHGNLPSNMKVSVSGSSIKISELRQEQEGVLACSVYSNLDVLATKKRFLIKDLYKNRDVLQSSPNHSLIFKEEFRNKRDPKTVIRYFSSLKPSRQKRARLAVDEVERALFPPSTTENEVPGYTTSEARYNDYRPYAERDYEMPQSLQSNKNKFQEIDAKFEKFPENRQTGISIKQEPEAVEGQPSLELPQRISDELSFQAGIPENAPDRGTFLNKPGNLQMNVLADEPEIESVKKPHQYSLENIPNKIQSSQAFDVSLNRLSNEQVQKKIFQSPNQKRFEQPTQYIDLDVQTKGFKLKKPNKQSDQSNIILNIGGIKSSRKTTAEIQIAKLVSYCFTDFECSVTANCVRASLKEPGYCKCLPGTNGVGIFCREEVWLSKSNVDIEQHNSDYIANTGTSPPE